MLSTDQRITELKQEALRSIIGKFSDTFIEDLSEYIELVKVIYADGFRHAYSDITAMLIRLNKENPQALDQISYNFSSLVDKFPKDEYPDAYKSLNKLYDHIVLEQIRLKEVYGDSKELAEHAKQLSDKATISLEKADKLVEQTTVVKTEVITVLGIFAAILLAFTGGMVFSTSVIENMHNVSIYKAVIVCVCIGFVFANVINILLDFIRDINKVSKEDSISNFTILGKRYRSIHVLSFVFGLIIFLMFLGMKYHWFGSEFYHVVEFVSK